MFRFEFYYFLEVICILLILINLQVEVTHIERFIQIFSQVSVTIFYGTKLITNYNFIQQVATHVPASDQSSTDMYPVSTNSHHSQSFSQGQFIELWSAKLKIWEQTGGTGKKLFHFVIQSELATTRCVRISKKILQLSNRKSCTI